MNIPPEKLETCLEVLQQISEDPSVINGHERMKGLIAKIHREGKRGERQAVREGDQAEDRRRRAMTAIVSSQRGNCAIAALPANAAAPGGAMLRRVTHCYICKAPYTELHFFYHLLCPTCAAYNYEKRCQRADLKGRVALVTGGRIKIGYQATLRMLRDGARVIVTTRFPHDAALRFRTEDDFDNWQDRLQIYGLDLRNLSAVEAFIDHLLTAEPWLDILINNAAQTIKRPQGFYAAALERERLPYDALPHEVRRLIAEDAPGARPAPASASDQRDGQSELRTCLPAELLDADGQPLDTRPSNSWALRLDQVSSLEMLEVQLVNAVAPFMLNSRLKPLLLQSPFARRFIVNVSAMEGQFNRESKTSNHPHTNMAKAALNMMTRTSASDYACEGIFMNSVDTGWITDENPYDKKIHLREKRGFYTPLDVIDGMARIYDPIVQGIAESAIPPYGFFLKDYAPCAW